MPAHSSRPCSLRWPLSLSPEGQALFAHSYRVDKPVLGRSERPVVGNGGRTLSWDALAVRQECDRWVPPPLTTVSTATVAAKSISRKNRAAPAAARRRRGSGFNAQAVLWLVWRRL